jgi:hypothetical protein
MISLHSRQLLAALLGALGSTAVSAFPAHPSVVGLRQPATMKTTTKTRQLLLLHRHHSSSSSADDATVSRRGILQVVVLTSLATTTTAMMLPEMAMASGGATAGRYTYVRVCVCVCVCAGWNRSSRIVISCVYPLTLIFIATFATSRTIVVGITALVYMHAHTNRRYMYTFIHVQNNSHSQTPILRTCPTRCSRISNHGPRCVKK